MPVAAAALGGYEHALCCTDARFAAQSRTWDCGHSNVAALLATLANGSMPSLAAHGLRQVPSARAIAELLEAAWRAGWDPEGARHFRGKIVGKSGPAAYLGVGEFAALLWHLRVEGV